MSKMRRVAHVSDITDLKSYLRTVPDPLLNFAALFLARLSHWIGVDLFIEPERSSIYPDTDAGLHDTLHYLVKRGVIKSYYEEKNTYDDEPRFLRSVVNIAGRSRMGHSGYGKSLSSPAYAWWSAVGEAVERWSLDTYDRPRKDRLSLTMGQIKKAYEYDLSRVSGISPVSRASANGERTYTLDPTATFECVLSEELVTQKRIPAPLQWFSFTHARRVTDRGYEPVLMPLNSSGAATGRDRGEAEYKAMLEVIERDAAMIHWHRGIVPKRLSLESLKVNSEVAKRIAIILERYSLEAHLMVLSTDFPVLVVQTILIDRTGVGPAVLCDSAAGTSLDHCLERSFLGALGLRTFVRRYMSSYKPGPVESLTMRDRALWWSRTDRLPLIEPYLSGDFLTLNETRAWERSAQGTNRIALVKSFGDKDYRVYSQMITPLDVVAATGLQTVVVRSPDMQPIYFDEWERGDFGQRMEDVPQRLGLHCSDTFNSLPHPYA